MLESCDSKKNEEKIISKKSDVEILLPDSSLSSVQGNLEFQIKLIDSTGPPLGSITSKYIPEKGVLGFRGALTRDLVADGLLNSKPTEISMEWEFSTDYNGKKTNLGIWGGGNGWTGQPLIINWDYPGIPKTALSHKPEAHQEVIISSLSGKIFFLDLASGKKLRPTLDTYNPIKGTAMFDPDFSGNLLALT